MPKLDATHLAERLARRLSELEGGLEVASRDILALLNSEQRKALADAWSAQEQLRASGAARTEDERRAIGWRTKREVRIEALRDALVEAKAAQPAVWRAKVKQANVRQTKVYFDALNEAETTGKDPIAARNWANNELTRAGLARLDGFEVRTRNPRDAEMRDIEHQLRSSAGDEPVDAE